MAGIDEAGSYKGIIMGFQEPFAFSLCLPSTSLADITRLHNGLQMVEVAFSSDSDSRVERKTGYRYQDRG